MTSEVIQTYRFRCDAPHCPATVDQPTHTLPDGWHLLTSSAHQNRHIPYATGTRAVRLLQAASDHANGTFRLHLCPTHPDAFTAHRPMTDGVQGVREVLVRCSCGQRLGVVADFVHDSRAEGPRFNTERVWWRHLPAELRWYATRKEP